MAKITFVKSFDGNPNKIETTDTYCHPHKWQACNDNSNWLKCVICKTEITRSEEYVND